MISTETEKSKLSEAGSMGNADLDKLVKFISSEDNIKKSLMRSDSDLDKILLELSCIIDPKAGISLLVMLKEGEETNDRLSAITIFKIKLYEQISIWSETYKLPNDNKKALLDFVKKGDYRTLFAFIDKNLKGHVPDADKARNISIIKGFVVGMGYIFEAIAKKAGWLFTAFKNFCSFKSRSANPQPVPEANTQSSLKEFLKGIFQTKAEVKIEDEFKEKIRNVIIEEGDKVNELIDKANEAVLLANTKANEAEKLVKEIRWLTGGEVSIVQAAVNKAKQNLENEKQKLIRVEKRLEGLTRYSTKDLAQKDRKDILEKIKEQKVTVGNAEKSLEERKVSLETALKKEKEQPKETIKEAMLKVEKALSEAKMVKDDANNKVEEAKKEEVKLKEKLDEIETRMKLEVKAASLGINLTDIKKLENQELQNKINEVDVGNSPEEANIPPPPPPPLPEEKEKRVEEKTNKLDKGMKKEQAKLREEQTNLMRDLEKKLASRRQFIDDEEEEKEDKWEEEENEQVKQTDPREQLEKQVKELNIIRDIKGLDTKDLRELIDKERILRSYVTDSDNLLGAVKNLQNNIGKVSQDFSILSSVNKQTQLENNGDDIPPPPPPPPPSFTIKTPSSNFLLKEKKGLESSDKNLKVEALHVDLGALEKAIKGLRKTKDKKESPLVKSLNTMLKKLEKDSVKPEVEVEEKEDLEWR
jgi:hypothetical protein